MYSRLQIGSEYILDAIMKKLGKPTPISYGEHVVIVDFEDGIYYILEPAKDIAIHYPVFYKVLKAGNWNKAIQQLLLTGQD